jgi:hypothetical protein
VLSRLLVSSEDRVKKIPLADLEKGEKKDQVSE